MHLPLRPALLLLGWCVAAGCPAGGDDTDDTELATELDTATDGEVHTDAPPLRACPNTAGCFLLSPAEAGLPASGHGATVNQVALRPATATRDELLLFLNGSGGAPLGVVSDPANNFYTAALDEGLHVLAVSYRSDQAIGVLCPTGSPNRDGCYEPTRTSLLTGRPQRGAASELDDITPDEGVYTRALAALTLLALRDPDGGWESFFDASTSDPEASLRWDKLLVAGHSQGGGHVALFGKRHAVARVVMLAAPCDSAGGRPATWLTRSPDYQTAATRFFGLGAASDPICPSQFDAWTALGMAPQAGDDTANLCPSADAHGAPAVCVENKSRWRDLLR